MSKSLNKLTESVFNLSNIFNKSSYLFSFANNEEAVVRQLANEMRSRVAGEYKQVFEERAKLAENLAFYYFNRAKHLDKKILENDPKLDHDRLRRESTHIKDKIVVELERYRFYCDLFSKAKSIKDIYGINYLIEVTIDLWDAIRNFESITTEDINVEIGITGSESMKSVIDSVFNDTLRNFFGVIVAGVGAKSEEEIIRQLRLRGISDNPDKEDYFEKLKEAFEADTEYVADIGGEKKDYYELKYTADSDKIKEIEDAFKGELVSSGNDDDLVAISDKLRNKIIGGDVGAGQSPSKGDEKAIQYLQTKFEKLKSNNTNRIKASTKRLEELEELYASSAPKDQVNLQRSIKLEKRVLEILKATEEDLDRQIRSAKIIDSISRQEITDTEEAKSKLEEIIRQSSESKKKLLLKVRQIHYVDPISSIEKVELSDNDANRILNATGNASANRQKFQIFNKAKEKYIEIKKNPQNYVGALIGTSNMDLINKLTSLGIDISSSGATDVQLLKLIIENSITILETEYINLKKSGKQKNWNPWVSSSTFNTILDVLKDLTKLVSESFEKRREAKVAWTQAISYQNAIATAAMNFLIAESDKEKSSEIASFNGTKAKAKRLLETKGDYLSPRIKETLSEIKGKDIESFSAQIDKSPILKFNTSLRYMHGRLESDVPQFKRNFIINIARDFLDKAKSKDTLDLKNEIFKIIKEHPRYISFKNEIYMEAFMLTLSETKDKNKKRGEERGGEVEFGPTFRPQQDEKDTERAVPPEVERQYSAFLRQEFPEFEGELNQINTKLIDIIPAIRKRLYQDLSDYIYLVIKQKVEEYVQKFWSNVHIGPSKDALEVADKLANIKANVNIVEKVIKEIIKSDFLSTAKSMNLIQKVSVIKLIKSKEMEDLKSSITEYEEVVGGSRFRSVPKKVNHAINMLKNSIEQIERYFEDEESVYGSSESGQGTRPYKTKDLNDISERIVTNKTINDWLTNNCSAAATQLRQNNIFTVDKAEKIDKFQSFVNNLIDAIFNYNEVKNIISSKQEISEDDLRNKIKDIIIYRYINDSLARMKSQ